MSSNCWDCGTSSAVASSSGGPLAIAIQHEVSENFLQFPLHKYGHAWQTIEKLYSCLLDRPHSLPSPPPSRLIVPGVFHDSPVLRELQMLLSSKEMPIHRAGGDNTSLPICSNRLACCDNSSAARMYPRIAQLRVVWHFSLPSTQRRAMRAHIYKAMGFSPSWAPNLVTLVSSSQARKGNKRYLDNEGEVFSRLNSFLSSAHTGMSLVLHVPESMPYAQEVKRMRMTRVYISLFSSALHVMASLHPTTPYPFRVVTPPDHPQSHPDTNTIATPLPHENTRAAAASTAHAIWHAGRVMWERSDVWRANVARVEADTLKHPCT